MKKFTRTILKRRRARSFTVVPVLVAGAFLTASVLPAQAASSRVLAADQYNAPGARSGVPDSFGTGSIVNFVTGFCLGTAGGHNNADAVVWQCKPGVHNQIWSLKAPNQIENANGDCLGVAGGSTELGAPVVAWHCQPGAPNQSWTYGNGPDCYHISDPDTFTVIRNNETGMVIGVSGASTQEGADLIMWNQQPCSGNDENQYWFWPVP